jgi:hypothetical protein
MDVGVAVVLPPGAQGRHLYDMGSTTELRVRCAEQRFGHGGGVIALLARNEPPQIECSVCGRARNGDLHGVRLGWACGAVRRLRR